MDYKRKLTFAQLIRLMSGVTSKYGRFTQRGTLTDIADLWESYQKALLNSSYVERFWGVRFEGTILVRTCDFGEWERLIEERYRIMWSENSGWTFEEL